MSCRQHVKRFFLYGHAISVSTRRSVSAAPPYGGRGRFVSSVPKGFPALSPLPSERTTILSAASTVRIRWAMTRTVLPASRREGFLNSALIFHVQAGGGFVQQNDGRILQEGRGQWKCADARRRKGRSHSRRSWSGSPGEFPDKFIAPGGSGGCDHFLIRSAPAAKTDIFHHRIPEQHHILEYHGIGAKKRFRPTVDTSVPPKRTFPPVTSQNRAANLQAVDSHRRRDRSGRSLLPALQ